MLLPAVAGRRPPPWDTTGRSRTAVPARPWRRGTVEGRASQPISTVIESPGQERPRQREADDGAVGRERIDRLDRLAHDPDVAHVIEGEVGVLQVVEAPAALDRIGVGPAGAGAERVEIEMERERRQRVGRRVPVADPLAAAQHPGGLVEPRADLVGDLLLPGGIRGRGGGLLQGEQHQCDHERLDGRGWSARGTAATLTRRGDQPLHGGEQGLGTEGLGEERAGQLTTAHESRDEQQGWGLVHRLQLGGQLQAVEVRHPDVGHECRDLVPHIADRIEGFPPVGRHQHPEVVPEDGGHEPAHHRLVVHDEDDGPAIGLERRGRTVHGNNLRCPGPSA